MSDDLRDCLPTQDFDREFSLAELLAGVNQAKLGGALTELLSGSYCVTASSGEVLLGEALADDVPRVPLRADMEAVGYVAAVAGSGEQLKAAATFLELLMQSGARYLMASSLHLQAMRDEYEKLQQEHTALQASETRYKDLNENLESRVSEQVKTIEDTQMQLYQAEKMASVGQLAAGVAHEINNPIGFIQSNLETAKSYVNDFSELFGLVKERVTDEPVLALMKEKDIDFVLEDFEVLANESLDGARRVSSIVKDLKGFSNVDGSDEAEADINEIIESVCSVSAPEVSRSAELRTELGVLPKSVCQPAQLGQVFLNLLLNSAKSIESDGQILVRSQHKDNDIVVSVLDNGSGISVENLKRIFDPFFTTADVGSGTGLGLTVCRDIVKAHGGEIEARSTEGKGSIFIVRLPIKH